MESKNIPPYIKLLMRRQFVSVKFPPYRTKMITKTQKSK